MNEGMNESRVWWHEWSAMNEDKGLGVMEEGEGVCILSRFARQQEGYDHTLLLDYLHSYCSQCCCVFCIMYSYSIPLYVA